MGLIREAEQELARVRGDLAMLEEKWSQVCLPGQIQCGYDPRSSCPGCHKFSTFCVWFMKRYEYDRRNFAATLRQDKGNFTDYIDGYCFVCGYDMWPSLCRMDKLRDKKFSDYPPSRFHSERCPDCHHRAFTGVRRAEKIVHGNCTNCRLYILPGQSGHNRFLLQLNFIRERSRLRQLEERKHRLVEILREGMTLR